MVCENLIWMSQFNWNVAHVSDIPIVHLKLKHANSALINRTNSIPIRRSAHWADWTTENLPRDSRTVRTSGSRNRFNIQKANRTIERVVASEQRMLVIPAVLVPFQIFQKP